ncbi:MAG TPA: glycosyltransferase, partial [Acidimicrobiia bacterium]
RLRRANAGCTVVVGAWAALLAPDLWLGRPNVTVWEHTLLRERLPYYPTLRRAFPVLARLYRRAESVVCVSGAVRDFVVESVGPRRARVIPNIVADHRSAAVSSGAHATPRSDSDGLRLLSTQRMVPVKHVELAVETLAHLPDSATLVCAGDGPRRGAIEALAAASGVGARVAFPGHVDDVGTLMTQTDVLVHTAYSETFGLSLVEAAAHGVPVACLAGGALAEMVPEYVPGVVVGEASAGAFAEGVRRAATLSGDTERFAAAAARRAVTFGEAVVLEQWHAELERLAGVAVTPR